MFEVPAPRLTYPERGPRAVARVLWRVGDLATMDEPSQPNRPGGPPHNASIPFSPRYFARRTIVPAELPGIMRRHIYTGALGNVWGFLISGIFFVYYGNAVGMNAFDWGVLGGLSSIFLTAELFGARLTRRVGRRKWLWFYFALTSRCVRLAGVLISWWLFTHGLHGAVAALTLSVSLSSLFGALSTPPWMSWLADLIPTERHGRFMARRTWWINISVIAAVVPAAWLIDTIPDQGNMKLNMSVAIFVVATAIGLADLFIHGTIPEPKMAPPKEDADFGEQLLEPLRDRRYRQWLTFVALWTFGMSLGGSMMMVYLVGDLGIKDDMLVGTIVIIVLGQLGVLLGSRKYGYFVDRFGVKPVLFWGHVGWAFFPFLWFWASKENAIYLVGLASFAAGSAANAAVIAANKLITRYPPAGHRVATYSAVSNCVSYVSSALAWFTAGTIVWLVGPGHIERWGISFCAFHVLFGISFFLRLSFALFLVPRIKVPEHLEEQQKVEGEAEESKGDWLSMLRP